MTDSDRGRTPPPGGTEGIVIEAVGGLYRILLDDGREVEAFLRGRLKQMARTGDRVVAGDRVRVVRIEDGSGHTVEDVLPRKTELVRAGPGGRKPKVVAANLDRCLVVLAAVEPPFREETADRFLALAESCGIQPVLVLNKLDLPEAQRAVRDVADVYRAIGYEVLPTSARTGEGQEGFATILSEGISVLVGPSGVGKSSLLNALDPALKLRTAPVSARGARGKHTTVSARLLSVGPRGWVADTPGFSDLALWGMVPRELSRAFPDFEGPTRGCRFRGCTHSHEPDCGVKEAVADGQVRESRYRSYLAILSESSGGTA